MKKVTPQFSVAIPVYNSASFLHETLDAVLNQSYPPSEVIVVDDGSTDNSWKIIQSYGDQLKAFQIKNSGAGNARNVAAQHATCDWLAFCDSDDVWLKNHLERRVQLLDLYPDTNFAFSDMQPFGPAALANKTYFSDIPKQWWQQLGTVDKNNFLQMPANLYRLLLTYGHNPVGVPTITMTHKLYQQLNGINPKYSRMPAEDADLTRRAAIFGNVVCDMTVTAKQRRHDNNMSRVEIENMIGMMQILQDHLKEHIAPNDDIPFVKKTITETLHRTILTAFYKRDFQSLNPILHQIHYLKLPFGILLRLIYLYFSSLLKK